MLRCAEALVLSLLLGFWGVREIRRVCQALPFGEDRISDGPGFLKVFGGL